MNKREIFKLQPPSNIGIVGGGQLGRMLTVEAKRMGYNIIVLDLNLILQQVRLLMNKL